MGDQRLVFVAEIGRLKTACRNTDSKYLKRDYQKAIRRKTLQLRAYDRYRAEKPTKERGYGER